MMGRQTGEQAALFYSFNLDQHIPSNHLLRDIDRVLDLSDLHQYLAPYYSQTGRPSIDPALMIRMLLIGYCFGIRSERRLCEEVHLNLAYRWFCRLGLQDPVPDHSSFSKNRHGRFRDSETFRHLFEGTIRRGMQEGLIKGEGFAIDASLIKADANRQRAVPGGEVVDWQDPKRATRAVREYVDGLEAVNPADPVPKSISLTDPCARWTAREGPAFFAYSTNYLIDLHLGMIVDVQASPATLGEEVKTTRVMLDRVEGCFDMKPQRLVGDTAYGTGALLGWLVDDKQIAPHIPVWDKSERDDGTFGRSAFTFDAAHNCYVCPAGKLLTPAWRSKQKNRFRYRASLLDCQACPLKTQCCPNMPQRNIDRSPHEAARDVARTIAKTDAYKQSRNDRKKVEMLFAHLKRILKFDRLRLRGPKGAQDEFLLAATLQNLRRMAKQLAQAPPKTQFAIT